MPNTDKETWMIYAKKQGVSEAKAKEYWNIAKESSKNKEDYEYIMGTFKKIISNSKKEQVMKEKEEDKKDISQFTTYAKNEGMDNEEQAQAIFFQVRAGVAKEAGKDAEELGGEEMGKLWGAYKDAIKTALEKKEESIILSNRQVIEGIVLKKGAKLKFLEAFKSGSAASIVQKLGNILGRKIGSSITFSDIPMEYENSYGKFAGFLGAMSNGLMIKINFLLSGSDAIESFDIYLNGYDSAPSYTVDTNGMNIVQIIDLITENLIDDGEADEGALEESVEIAVKKELQLKERSDLTSPDGVALIIEKWVEEDKSILSSLQKNSMADIFNGIWGDWVSDKPNYKAIKYYLFTKAVKQYLLARGMTNKTFKVRKKGSKESQIKDPALAAQFDDVVESLTWKEKFDFFDGVLEQLADGYLQSIYVYGSPGCLSGDTKLKIKRSNRLGNREYSLEEAYIKFNQVGKGEIKREHGFKYWDSKYETQIQSYNEKGFIEYKPIQAITYSGEKEVFEVVLSNGKTIKATKDHKFIKDGNFLPLSKLSVGDLILVQSENPVRNGRQKGRRFIYSCPYHPYAMKQVIGGFDYKRLQYAYAVLEADMNNLSIPEFIDILRHDEAKAKELKYIGKGYEVHHKDGDCTNDSITNLLVTSKEAHLKEHTLISVLANKEAVAEYSTIISISKKGIEKTYDITMKDEGQPNFVANGIVVHNSGKSYQVVNTLDRLNATYKIYKGGVKTMDDLIRILWNNREDTLLIFDDFDSVLKLKDSANIFKAVLENKPVREVKYIDVNRNKNKSMADVPQKFDFSSGVVFISNSPKLDSAVASRSIVLEISLSNEEMLDKMKSSLATYRPDIDMKVKMQALEYMQEISEGVAGLDYRMMDNIIIAMKVNPSGWKKLSLWMINSVV